MSLIPFYPRNKAIRLIVCVAILEHPESENGVLGFTAIFYADDCADVYFPQNNIIVPKKCTEAAFISMVNKSITLFGTYLKNTECLFIAKGLEIRN